MQTRRRACAGTVSASLSSAPDARGTSTSRPMPSVSNAHSASVTARPPSEQSCADSRTPCAAAVVRQRDQRALALQIERRRQTPHQAMDGLQVFAAAELAEALAEQDDRVAGIS